jgi:predicted metal-dependent enzyme (double-stranded beta helix superfamily)
MATVFDVDEFVDECHRARAEAEPRLAVRDVLRRALSTPASVASALDPQEGGLTMLHHDDELTVLHVVWAPGMTIFPHDHRMWAVIGIYAGQEDNAFYRRSGPSERTLVESGGKQLTTGDVLVLGDDTIHSVTNPLGKLTAAIHVYGGDFVNQPRSQWGPGPREERPYDMAIANQQFAEANAAWRAATAASSAAGRPDR